MKVSSALLVFSLGLVIGILHQFEDVWFIESFAPQPLTCTADGCKRLLSPGKSARHSDTQLLPDKLKVGSSDPISPKYLFAVAAGVNQRSYVDRMISKFPEQNFSIILYHYDNRINEWSSFHWFHRAVHVAAKSQTKWWFAKRFLHPDTVATYEYIFLWDEDLAVKKFNALRYLEIVRRYNLEISQPALDSKSKHSWNITLQQHSSDVHFTYCGATGPPCSRLNVSTIIFRPVYFFDQFHRFLMLFTKRFVEIMAPVFSRSVWPCVWGLIQNDLIHGWGLDLRFSECVEGNPTYRMGIVDKESVHHDGIPSLAEPGPAKKHGRMIVKERCKLEESTYLGRWENATINCLASRKDR